MLRSAANSLLSIIYPQQCRVCSRQVIGLDAGVACASCWNATRIFDGTEVTCAKCGNKYNGKKEGSFCDDCSLTARRKARSDYKKRQRQK